MRKKFRKRRVIVLVVLLLVLALLVLLLMRCHGGLDDSAAIRSVEENEKKVPGPRPVKFVELIYEQSFSPLPKSFQTPPEPDWPSAVGYFLQPLNGQLYSSDGRQEPLDGEALIGRRLRFYDKLWAHSPDQFGELIVAEEMDGGWKIDEQPVVEAMGGFDGYSHLRLPLEIEVAFEGESVLVSGGDKEIALEPGETGVVVTTEKEFALDELARSLNTRFALPQEGVEATVEMLLKHRRLLGLESGESAEGVRLYGRVVAVCHEAIAFGERDLLVIMQEGEEALLRGDIGTALVRFQMLTNILPENRMVSDQLAMAMNPPELIREGVLLEGLIHYSGDPPGEASLPPFVRATALDGAGRDEVAYLKTAERYAIHLLPGRYRIEVQQPGFQSEKLETVVEEGEPAGYDITLTESP